MDHFHRRQPFAVRPKHNDRRESACRKPAMKFELKMPDLSTTGSPIKILGWLVAVGDFVERGQAVLDVETDKATMEVEALKAGMLLQQTVAAGQEASAGEVLALFGTKEAAAESQSGTHESEQKAEFGK